MVSTEIYSFVNHTIEVLMQETPLEQIDDLTYRYQNIHDFFEYFLQVKKYLVRQEFERENGFSPSGYGLGKNGIYILKDGEKIRPLFKKIEIKGVEYPLDEIILSRLYEENLLQLYECDKFRCQLGDYDSFFSELHPSEIEMLELGVFNAHEVRKIWAMLKQSTRIYPLMRFLINSYKNYEGSVNEIFCELVPAHEHPNLGNNSSRNYNGNLRMTNTYRPPYKDD